MNSRGCCCSTFARASRSSSDWGNRSAATQSSPSVYVTFSRHLLARSCAEMVRRMRRMALTRSFRYVPAFALDCCTSSGAGPNTSRMDEKGKRMRSCETPLGSCTRTAAPGSMLRQMTGLALSGLTSSKRTLPARSLRKSPGASSCCPRMR